MRQRGRFGSIDTSIYTLVFKTVEVKVDLLVKIPIIFLPQQFISSSAVGKLDTPIVELSRGEVFELTGIPLVSLKVAHAVFLKCHTTPRLFLPIERNKLETF